jgi:leucyl aminopeptidase
MNADDFYVTEDAHAVEIKPVCKKHLEQFLKTISEKTLNWLKLNQFQAESGQICLCQNEQGHLESVYLGLDCADDMFAYAKACGKLPPGCYYSHAELTKEAILFWGLSQYKFDYYKKNDAKSKKMVIDKSLIDEVCAIVNAIGKVRDLINTPTNDMGPEQLAQEVEIIAGKYGAQFKQIVGEQLLTDNYPAIHAVGRAASQEPRLLELTWGEKSQPHLVLVGKGVCFDSGGLNLKPGSSMRLMKKDMGGAAHALGLAQLIMQLKLPLRITLLIPAVENCVSSNAYRPGDIISTRKGLTVEIDNTDAEGRLIVADALVRGCEGNPDLIIDYTTLTGAARVAVGTEIAAMFTTNDEIAHQLGQLSKKLNDPVWLLPLYQPYKEMITSKVADLVNSANSPYAGATTAALFLQQFVDENTDWIHFDVMAWNVSTKPGKPEGGEAMSIRCVYHYLKDVFCKSSSN